MRIKRIKTVITICIVLAFVFVLFGGALIFRVSEQQWMLGEKVITTQWIGTVGLTAGVAFYFVGRVMMFVTKMKRK